MADQVIEVTRPGPAPLGARVVALLQYLLVAAYLLGAGGPLLTAAVRTGDYQGLLEPGIERFGDPKDVIPPVGPETLWNPLTWVFGIARVVSFFAADLAFLMALLGLGQLVRAEVRAHRPAFTRLVVGTIASAALVAFAFTWYGERLQTWLLD